MRIMDKIKALMPVTRRRHQYLLEEARDNASATGSAEWWAAVADQTLFHVGKQDYVLSRIDRTFQEPSFYYRPQTKWPIEITLLPLEQALRERRMPNG